MKRFFIILLTLVSVTIIFANKSQRSIKQEQQRTNKEISETTKKIDENKKQIFLNSGMGRTSFCGKSKHGFFKNYT